MLLAVATPAQAQWGGDASQAGATAYCGARFSGKNHKQASRAATNVLVNSMGGSFSSNIATIVTGGGAMRDSMNYLIQQQCPGYFNNDSAAAQMPPPRPSDQQEWHKYCSDNPWLKECGGQNPSATSCPDCSRTNVPSGQSPLPAKGEIKTQPQKTVITTAPGPTGTSKQEAHRLCSKVADYAGCMKYQLTQ
jgi:hypothetical protein